MQTFFPFLTFPKGTDLSTGIFRIADSLFHLFQTKIRFFDTGNPAYFFGLFQPLMLLAFNILIRVLVLFGKVHNLVNSFNKNQNR